jgi:hypothetical protein
MGRVHSDRMRRDKTSRLDQPSVIREPRTGAGLIVLAKRRDHVVIGIEDRESGAVGSLRDQSESPCGMNAHALVSSAPDTSLLNFPSTS